MDFAIFGDLIWDIAAFVSIYKNMEETDKIIAMILLVITFLRVINIVMLILCGCGSLACLFFMCITPAWCPCHKVLEVNELEN